MLSKYMFVAGAFAMVGVIAAVYGATLLSRAPGRPQWLRAGWVDWAIMGTLVSIGLLGFGLELRTMVAAHVDPLLALSLEFAFIAAAAVVLWKTLHVGERLDAAGHGLSPFARLRDIRHHGRRHMAGPDAA